MLFGTAFAQSAPAAGPAPAFDFVSLAPLLLIFVVFYFLLIRPQQKKMRDHKSLVAALKRGDRVVTSGGLIGTVSKVVSDSELQLEIAEGVRVRAVRSSITDVLSKGTGSDVATGDEPEDAASAAGADRRRGAKGR